MKGLRDATLDGNRLVGETLQLLPQVTQIPEESNQPKLFFWSLFFIIVLLSFYKSMQTPLLYFDVFLFMLLGLLGCFMLFMWLGTEHAVCAWNRNLYWAFPLHILFAYLLARHSPKVSSYARYASWLLIVSMIYGLIAEQKYIPEITPLLLLILIRLGKYARPSTNFSFKFNM
jgi:hypothetical protein